MYISPALEKLGVITALAPSSNPIVATVPASVLARLRSGMPAMVSVEGAPDTVPGVVQGISPAVDSITNAGVVVIRLQRFPASFRPGAGATARVVTAVHPNALIVSDSAVVILGATPTVFVIQPDSTVKAIPVEVTVRSGGLVEVKGDLKPGDRIVTTGAYGLSNGMHVIPGGAAATGAPRPAQVCAAPVATMMALPPLSTWKLPADSVKPQR